MLSAMRNNAKKYHWTLWLVILAFVGGFVAVDIFRGDKTHSDTGLVYADGKEIIQGADFERQLYRTLESYRNQFKSNFNKSMIAQMRIPEQILKRMLYMAIIKIEADKLHLSATDQETKDKILNNPQFQRDGQFIGLEQYQRMLAHYRISVSEFEEEVRNDVLTEKLKEVISGSLTFDPASLPAEYKKEKDKIEMDAVILRPDRVKTPDSEIKVEDQELANFYAEHKNEFKSAEKRAGYVIAYNFDDFKKEISISEKDVFDTYNKNKHEFTVPGRTKVSRILLKYTDTNREEIFKKAEALQKELTKDNFATKSKEVSEDVKAQTGGDYGYSEWRSFSEQENAIIEKMNINEISTPIDTRTGFAILWVSEKINESIQPFDLVKQSIRANLEQEQLSKVVTQKLEKIHEKLDKVENIKAKAADMNVKAIETDLLTMGQGIKGVDDLGYISRRLFSAKGKEILFPVQYAKGIAIAQVSRIEKPVVEPFEKVKDRVKARVITAKKVEMLKSEAASLATELNGITDAKKVEEVLKAKNLTAESINYKRGNTLSSLPMKKGLDDMLFGSTTLNSYGSPIAFDNAVAIVKIKTITITTPADFEKDKIAFADQKTKELQDAFFASYMENKMESYKITTNPELMQKIEEDLMRRF